MTPQQLIETENELSRLWNEGEINSLLHLEGSVDGSYEQFMCDFFRTNVRPKDWVCASHRCHFAYQLHGGENLIEQVKRGRSMFLYHPRFLCSAIVAGVASIAVGLALAIQRRNEDERVFCFLGDGALDHGHALEAIQYTAAKQIPVHFVVTDNDSSCGVSRAERRGRDWQWPLPECVTRFQYRATFPHAGTGNKMTLKRLTPP